MQVRDKKKLFASRKTDICTFGSNLKTEVSIGSIWNDGKKNFTSPKSVRGKELLYVQLDESIFNRINGAVHQISTNHQASTSPIWPMNFYVEVLATERCSDFSLTNPSQLVNIFKLNISTV